MIQVGPNLWLQFEPDSRTDKYGKCFFWLYWYDDYTSGGVYVGRHRRGQAFYADPTERGYPRPEHIKYDLMAQPS